MLWNFLRSRQLSWKRYIIIGAGLGFCLIGCLSLILGFTTGHAKRSSHRIALLLKAKNNAFYDAIVLGAREQAAKYGMELTLRYGRNEDDWQTQVHFLREESSKFDGFIVIPNRSDQFGEAFEDLSQKEKPIVVVDTPVTKGAEFTLAMVSSDNITGGRLAGLFLAEQMAKNEGSYPCVVLLSGNPHSKTHQDRNAGFLDVMHSARPNLPVQVLYGNSSFDTARQLVQEHLKEVSKCGAVFAGSDTMILGLLTAFDGKAGMVPDLIVGYDSIIEVQREILRGRMSASVQQLPAEMGRVAIQTLHDHFQKLPSERKVLIPPRLSVRRFQLDTLSEEDLERQQKQSSVVRVASVISE